MLKKDAYMTAVQERKFHKIGSGIVITDVVQEQQDQNDIELKIENVDEVISLLEGQATDVKKLISSLKTLWQNYLKSGNPRRTRRNRIPDDVPPDIVTLGNEIQDTFNQNTADIKAFVSFTNKTLETVAQVVSKDDYTYLRRIDPTMKEIIMFPQRKRNANEIQKWFPNKRIGMSQVNRINAFYMMPMINENWSIATNEHYKLWKMFVNRCWDAFKHDHPAIDIFIQKYNDDLRNNVIEQKFSTSTDEVKFLKNIIEKGLNNVERIKNIQDRSNVKGGDVHRMIFKLEQKVKSFLAAHKKDFEMLLTRAMYRYMDSVPNIQTFRTTLNDMMFIYNDQKQDEINQIHYFEMTNDTGTLYTYYDNNQQNDRKKLFSNLNLRSPNDDDEEQKMARRNYNNTKQSLRTILEKTKGNVFVADENVLNSIIETCRIINLTFEEPMAFISANDLFQTLMKKNVKTDTIKEMFQEYKKICLHM